MYQMTLQDIYYHFDTKQVFPEDVELIHGGKNERNHYGRKAEMFREIDMGPNTTLTYRGDVLKVAGLKVGAIVHKPSWTMSPSPEGKSCQLKNCDVTAVYTENVNSVTLNHCDTVAMETVNVRDVLLKDNPKLSSFSSRNVHKLKTLQMENTEALKLTSKQTDIWLDTMTPIWEEQKKYEEFNAMASGQAFKQKGPL